MLGGLASAQSLNCREPAEGLVAPAFGPQFEQVSGFAVAPGDKQAERECARRESVAGPRLFGLLEIGAGRFGSPQKNFACPRADPIADILGRVFDGFFDVFELPFRIGRVMDRAEKARANSGGSAA